ncbi:MAG: DEAD/DEAH box helicase [Prevotellaceae bacterium]|nr:DEAD/DEAH box helicase [Prevotellaceae bacterium]
MDIDKVLERLNIVELNDMQQAACKNVLGTPDDVVILSPTGSGKTLAYLLPTAHLVDETAEQVQVIVVVPGRELALQSSNVLKSMACGVRAVSCYGGRPAMDEHKTLRQVKPQVVFGTPGRLNDHLQKGNISPYGVRMLVIDEFDKCLEMGFHDEMARLVKRLPGLQRRLLLSATDADEIPHFINLDSARRLDFLNSDEQVPARVTIHEVRSPMNDKLEELAKLLRSFGSMSSIVFLNYRDGVERTADYLRRQGFVVSHFHGGLEQRQREDALYSFSNGSANVLVSTDLASRGLDIPDVDNIIHYHLPLSEDGYVHRVGRTARWEAKGRTFFVLGPSEHLPDFIDGDIQTYQLPDTLPAPPQPRMATIYIGKGKKDKISRGDIVGFLCKKGGLTSGEIGKIDVKERYSYAAVARGKLQQLLKNVTGEKLKGLKTVVEAIKKQEKQEKQ